MVVDVAINGEQAFNKEKEADYDLILMDIQMPVVDGITATVNIRSLQKYQLIHPDHLAKVLVENKDLCQMVGMNDFIIKPYRRDHLFSILVK